MKIKHKTEIPEYDGEYLTLSTTGYVGISLFKNGKWYILPDKRELIDIDFYWVSLL